METARHRVGRRAARLAGALAAVTLSAPLAPASADMQAGREQPLPSVERLISAARGTGDKPIDFTLPLMRASSNTVYLNLRAQGADALMDGDVSIAYQGSVDRALAVGGYALGVIEHGERGLAPRQVTFGGEAANDWLRLNGNVCLPDTTCVPVAPPTPRGGSLAERSVVGISATALDVGGTTPTGLDAELSLHLRNPINLPGDWRLSAGASHVLDQGLGFSAAAPRGRLEVTFDEALEATGIRGAKLTLGGEMHCDETQGPLAVVSARVNIPLYGARR
ncbi:MAG TPA: hypothetical protein VMV26_09830 [Alphaproteobacteria bacterium]|nr:hypothetical protein [Alphaproteobacteria bacterium]